jgi:replicative DNA helicase
MTNTLDAPQKKAEQIVPHRPSVPMGEEPPYDPAFDMPPPDEDFAPHRPSVPLEQAPPADFIFDVAPPDVEDEDLATAPSRPDKSIPYNLEAEEAVLGALLIDHEAVLRVAPFLKPDDFYIVKNGWIYDAILSLHEQRQSIDFLTVCDELENRKQIKEVGGQVYISTLINSVPTAIHVEAYAHIVERTALRRRLITAASQIAGFAYQEDQSVDEVLDRSEAVLFGISQRRIARDLTPIRLVVADYYDRIEYLYEHRGEPLGIPTNFVDLDKLLGGLQRSDLVIIAARPGVGKTSFLLGVALSAARKYKQKVGIFSLEMSNEQLVQRLMSSETGIDSQRLRLGDLREDEWPKFAEAAGRLSETMIFIDDTPGLSALQLRTKARRLHAEYGLDMIMVDYLQLMSGESRSENRVQEISYISRALKGLARELNVPLVAASQLSRAVEQRHDKRPILSDLRDSGSIEQDADVVMFLYRDELYNADTELKNIADVIVSKHRHGPTGTVQLFFRKHLTQFVDAEVYHRNIEF